MNIRDHRGEIDTWVDRSYGGTFAEGGGQRLVYRVPDRDAALKIWVNDDPAQHERHVREVSALSQLDHPALPTIVSPISQLELSGTIFALYLEEWVLVPSIKSQVSHLPFEAPKVCRIGREVAGALALLHGSGIVHRDISLGNVMTDGQSTVVTDLGLAKHLDLESVTAAGEQLPRTALTASPEQLQGASSDLRSPTDIFSLGVVLFFVLTGEHPYIAPGEPVELPTLIHRQLSGDIRHLATDNTIDDLLHRMLNPVTFYRPSAEAVAGELA